MKSKLFLLAIAFVSLNIQQGLAEERQRLVVSLIDGTTVEFVLGDKPSVTFPADKIHVESATLTADYPAYRVADFHFEDSLNVTGIKTIDTASRSHLVVDYRDGNEVVVHGIGGHHAVCLYSANGMPVKTVAASGEEDLHISTVGLAAGVYVVNIQDITSFKITVK